MIKTSRRFFLQSAIVLLAAVALTSTGQNIFGQTEPTTQPSELDLAIMRSTEFLLAQQAGDGGWHSEHYGTMKQGAANTALVLYAISHLPDEQLKTHSGTIKKATNFLLPGIEKKGCAANPDGSLDYPIYSTALILSAHNRIDLKLPPPQIRRMVKYLLDSQCMKSRGFTPQNLNHGGWDILGPGPTQGKTAGANVSVTFFVVEALSHFQTPTDKPTVQGKPQTNLGSIGLEKEIEAALTAATQWCQRIQSEDGGFYFSSQIKSTLNKAGWSDREQTSPNSYGSATCDGLSLLLKLGKTSSDKPAQNSIAWLAKHPGVDSVPGFKNDVDSIGWPSSLRFYYAAALSRSLGVFEEDQADKTSSAITKQLIDTQLKSGAWKNESSHMRENDELIATPFGLMALLNCKSHDDQQKR